MPTITIKQLTRRYGSRPGIENLNLCADPGALLGFLGPNGSGKTTTIRVLLGLLKPSEGSASILGLSCWSDTHRIKAQVGYVPGDLRLYPWLTCETALRIVGSVRRRDLMKPGLALAEEFDLEPRVPVRKMSRGMRQKLGLILALAHQPQVLILDEPTSSLDPLMQDQFCAHLQRLAAAGHTIFFSSHTLGEVERLCTRVAILREGRLLVDEPLEALRARAPRHVTLMWNASANAAAIPPPTTLNVTHRLDRHWYGTLNGSAAEFVRWSATQPIDDLTIGPPNLASLFSEWYASPETTT